LPHPAEASAPSILPPADPDTAWAALPAPAADVVAANGAPGRVTHAKRTGIGRHRPDGARKQRAGVSRPGANGRPGSIVQSGTGVLAALSLPSSRQTPGRKTH
jgi:hypothetical protein